MFTKEAIQELALAQAIGTANNAVIDAVRGNHAIALPKDFVLSDGEAFSTTRRRLRGTMTTSTPEDFATYVVEYQEAGAMVFVSSEEFRAVAVLNLGTTEEPGHADNLAILAPPKTAAYRALLSIANGQQKRQVDVAEYIEDWSDLITCRNEDGEIVQNKHAVAAIRKIAIEGARRTEVSETQLSSSRSTFEQVKAANPSNLPVFVDITCVPYECLAARTFTARLSIITGDKPALVLRIVRQEHHDEDMAKELCSLVAGHVDSAAVVLGKYSPKA